MTTILVTEDNEMLCDSQATSGDFIISYEFDKVENINGNLVGIAGKYSSCMAFKDWFASISETQSAISEYPNANVVVVEPEEDEQFDALILSPDGILTMFEGSSAAYEVSAPYAIGSGGIYALSALDGGANGKTAMEVAIKRDIYTGGEIKVHTLEQEEGLTKEDLEGLTKDEIISTLFGEEGDIPSQEG